MTTGGVILLVAGCAIFAWAVYEEHIVPHLRGRR